MKVKLPSEKNKTTVALKLSKDKYLSSRKNDVAFNNFEENFTVLKTKLIEDFLFSILGGSFDGTL